MKHWKILLLPALLLSALWFACRDQEFDEFQKQADVAFAGRIIDEAGQSIEGASVRAGGELAVTDASGVFRLKPVRLPAESAKISVVKIGYFDFSRTYIVEDDALQTVTIQLLKKELVGTFSASAGGTVSVLGGASLNFPAGAVNSSGTVRVFAKYLDPTSPDLSLHMPGDLQGINTSGEEQTLATFGMLGVEITDQGGQELHIASGSEVEISMPIPAGKLSVAPPSVPLWYYDHDKARWIEEGSAQKIGNQYVGKVKHFSFWNCDAPFPLVQLNGKIYLVNDEQPLANATVRLTILSTGWDAYGWTNANGCFGGCVAKDEVMKLEVLLPDQCGNQVLYTQDIGPFSSDAVLLPIIIPANPSQTPTVSLAGRLVDCGGQAVTEGYVKIQVGGAVFTAFTDQNGEFESNFINCANNTSGTAIGYDLANLLESAAQNFTISSNAVNLGDIQTCNALSEFIQYTLDGQSFTLIDPQGYVYPDTFPQQGKTTFLTANTQTNTIGLAFQNDDQTGAFPLSSLFVNGLEANQTSNLNTTVTGYGNVGAPIIGTFNGNFSDQNGTNHTISGSYRVIRDQ